MSGSRMRISVWGFCESVSPWQTSLNSSKKTLREEKCHLLLMAQLQAVQQFNITDHVCGGKNQKKKPPTAALTGCTWARPSGSAWSSWWGCTSAARPVGARRRTSAPARTAPSTRRYNSAGKRWESKVFMRIPTSVFRACEERFICPPSSSGSRSASSLSWMKFSAFVAPESFKGIQFPVLDEGLGSAKRWNLTGEKKKKMGFSPPRLLDVTNYQKNPMGKRKVIYRGAAVVEDFIC